MPKIWAADDWNWIVSNGKVYRMISIKDLFKLCTAQPGLFGFLVADLDGALESIHSVLHKKCYDSLKARLDLLKQGKPIMIGNKQLTSEVQTWVDDKVRWLAWKSNTVKGPPCPWDNCPPAPEK